MKWLVPGTVALLALLARLGYLFEIQDGPLFSRPVLLQSLDVSLWWPRMVQAAAGSASCVLVWLIGRRLFPRGVALAAALLATVYGPLLYYSGELLPATAAVFSVLLLLWLLTETPAEPVWRWLVPGMLVGIATLTTPAALLLLPFLLWWLGRCPPRSDDNGTLGWLRGIWLAAGCGIILVPVVTLYGVSPGPENVSSGLDIAARIHDFWRGAEIAHDHDLYFGRDESILLSGLLWYRWLAFPFGLTAPLALVGLALFLRTPDGRSRMGLLVTGFVVSGSLSVLLGPVTSLTRLPFVPVLLLLACYGAYRMYRGPGRVAAIGATVLLALLLNAGTTPLTASVTAREYFWRGQAFDASQMPANAMREYRLALQADPDFPEATLKLAALLSRRGEFGPATALYRGYLRHAPGSIVARRELAMALLASGKQDQALQELEEVVAREPDRADLQGTLAFVSLVSDKPERAAQAYRRVLALRPDSSLVRYQLARLHESQGRGDSAEVQYRLSLAAAPQHADTYQGLADLLISRAAPPQTGVTLVSTPALQEAEQLLLRVLRLDGKSLAAYWSLGRLLARQGRYEEAMAHFEALLQLTPDEYEAHLYLGGLYRRTGRAEEAEEEFRIYAHEQRARRLEAATRTQSEELARKFFDGQ